MPSINEHQHFTVMVEWELRPEHQQAFVHAVADAVAEHFPVRPGFVSATFHASHSGRRVVNYAQWTSREEWQAGTRDPGDVSATARLERADDAAHVQDPAAAAVAEVMRRFDATSITVDTFEVERTVESR